MKRTGIMSGCVGLALALTGAPANAQEVIMGGSSPVVFMAPGGPQAPGTPQAPGRPQPMPEAAAPNPVFSEAAPAGTEAPGGGYSPQMLGDSLFAFGAFRRTGTPSPFFSGAGYGSSNFQANIPIPIAASLSAFKISDNESPRPVDRAYLSTTYFTGVFHSVAEGDAHTRIAREIFGYEKTFLDGDASIGLRLPFFQLHSIDPIGSSNYSDVGDVSIITKFVLLRDVSTNNILSGGVVLTLPTGPTYFTGTNIGAGFPTGEKVNPTFLQPWVGFVRGSGDFFCHGFSAVAFAFDDSVDPTWFNDLGVGWYLYRGMGNNPSIIPTAELHITTPFGNRGLESSFPVSQIDTFVTTLGTHFLWNKANLTLGVGFPWSGPQPFSTELIAQFNFLF